MAEPSPTDAATIHETAEALAAHLLAHHPARQAVGRAGLAGLPGPVARRVAARLDARVDTAAPPPASPWVNAEHEAAREAARAWRAGAREAAQVPAEHWPDVLADACRDALAHLVRPAETLAAVAFEDAPDGLPAAVALRRARAFTPYPFLPQIAAEYAERKGVARLDRAEAEALFRRIDRRMLADATADAWLAHLAPLFDLAGRVGSPAGTLPRDLLALAFEAKDRADLVDALGDADALTLDDLRACLADVLPEPEAPPPALTEPPPRAIPEPPPDATPPGGPPWLGSPAAPRVGADALDWLSTATLPPTAPLDPFDAPAADAMDEEDATPADEPFPDAPAEDSPTDPDEDAPADDGPNGGASADDASLPLWMRFAPPSAPDPVDAPTETPLWMRFATPDAEPDASPADTPPDDLGALEARVLGPGDAERRAWFARELFAGDIDGYHETLGRLDRARSWTEASEVLAADLFRTRGVSLYAEAAVAFTDLVESRLTRRSGR